MIHTDLEIPYQGSLLAGVDEAGRGPLAGPVIAAAVILDPDRPVEGINDSKKLSASKREYLAERIKSEAVCWSVGRADVSEIDNLNILQATMLAMSRAVAALHPAAEYILVDGNRCPEVDCAARAIIKGDQQVMAIAAASIIAKVARDEEMLLLHDRYPCYGFNQHKGYGTREHLSALEQHGASPVHRASFAPVRKVIKGTSA